MFLECLFSGFSGLYANGIFNRKHKDFSVAVMPRVSISFNRFDDAGDHFIAGGNLDSQFGFIRVERDNSISFTVKSASEAPRVRRGQTRKTSIISSSAVSLFNING
jgi:hypothetical protein